MTVTLHHGDCIDIMRTLPDNSVDAIVTDPPYGLGFMGKAWDELPPGLPWAIECLRVLKPGGHLLAFGGTRTFHRLAVAVEDAGFEIRDSIAWLYGSGFPKSLDVSKAIDKAAGAEREVVGIRRGAGMSATMPMTGTFRDDAWVPAGADLPATAPATDDARTWQGWGTAMKPAFEPIVVARKPLIGTVAANVLTHGTGALNIDATRIEGEPWKAHDATGLGSVKFFTEGDTPVIHKEPHTAGRWPANVVLDESQADALDEQSGTLTSGKMMPTHTTAGTGGRPSAYGADVAGGFTTMETYGDAGGASRFFYTAKADASERVRIPAREERADSCRICEAARAEGLDPREVFVDPAYPEHVEQQHALVTKPPVAHPTVKPLSLMRWLVRLVTPPGGTVLEPFAGSGTTVEACILEGFQCVAIEREADYLPLIQQRINRRRDPVAAIKTQGEDGGLFDLLDGGAA